MLNTAILLFFSHADRVICVKSEPKRLGANLMNFVDIYHSCVLICLLISCYRYYVLAFFGEIKMHILCSVRAFGTSLT